MIKQLFAIAALAAMPTLAHSEVTNEAVKARMAAMKTIGGGMKTLGDMAKGAMAFDAVAAQGAVDSIEVAAAKVPALFEPQETDPKSEAKPEIWTNWDDFVTKAEALEKAAAGIAISAEADIGAAMGALGGACKACHSDYKL